MIRRKFFKTDHWLDKLYYFFFDLFWGLYYKYPLCCVIQFSYESLKATHSAEYRWETFGIKICDKPPKFKEKRKYVVIEKIQHVPCNRCMRKIIKRM